MTKLKKLEMSQKKIFLLLIAISSVSLLLRHGGHLNLTFEAFWLGCTSSTLSTGSSDPALKHTSVAFLKTHKTASSTVQNILFRFAERNNLTVALPVTSCAHQFCYPRTFSSRFVHPHTTPPDIITNHLRFSRAEIRRLMPNNTIYITILREPGAMFESLFSYYNQYCQSFKRVPNGSLEMFLEHPWNYYRPEDNDSMYARNTLTFDLGGDKDRPSTEAPMYATRFAEELERVFSLVMISEYFDESLVLLRRLLSWDLDDVLYMSLNMRTQSSKSRLSSVMTKKVRAWNAIDSVLYDYFNASLWRQLRALGLPCVEREVQMLRQSRDRLVRGCFGGYLPQLRSASQIANKELRPWQPSSKVAIVGYDLPANITQKGMYPRDDCLKMIMPEVQYSQLLLRSESFRYRKRFLQNSQQSLRSVGSARVHKEPRARNYLM
ncbi:galactose-3-O-sulfotransferase 3 isoform X2 [Misgurnus anguillicaudatus]|uniref:galactose-3-O-sulfotransferase 3 isoform X2 n=1 Tax=Misgurnus anguillicaudatus TaxID=75329 RepID=UPI002434C439|nr:galactose-3-O-sulfotransferase 3 isoform X2 [Misgurnus anguillicaudatus]